MATQSMGSIAGVSSFALTSLLLPVTLPIERLQHGQSGHGLGLCLVPVYVNRAPFHSQSLPFF